MTKQGSRPVPRIGPTGMAGALGLLLLVLLAVLGPVIWGADAAHMDVAAARQGPSARHLLGTDALGRDMLARVLSGSRLALVLAVLATLLGAVTGVLLAVVGLGQTPHTAGTLAGPGSDPQRTVSRVERR